MKPSRIRLKTQLGTLYLDYREAQIFAKQLRNAIDNTWEEKERMKDVDKFISEFENSNRQFPDELFLPKTITK